MPFRLDLVRHGDAVPPERDGGDAARVLSRIGRREVARLAEEYVRRGWRPDRVLASPLRRAQETAEILLARIGSETPLETIDELDPSYGGTAVIAALRRASAGARHVLAIGHQPLLGQLAGALTGGKEIGFPPAGMARLEFGGEIQAGEGMLVERLLPDDLG